MKTKFFTLLFALIAFNAIETKAGTFTTVKSGNYNDPTIWDAGVAPVSISTSTDDIIIASGHTVGLVGSTYCNSLVVNGFITGISQFVVAADMTVNSPNLVTSSALGGNYTVKGNLTISTGAVWTLSTVLTTWGNVNINGTLQGTGTGILNTFLANFQVQGANPTVTINGRLGAPSIGADGESVRVQLNHTGTATFTGNGIVNIARFSSYTSNITDQATIIDVNMNINNLYTTSNIYAFTLHNGNHLTSIKTLTINAGKTVTLTQPSCYFHAFSSAGIGNFTGGTMTYNIDGTLDVSACPFNLSTSSKVGANNVLTVNVGSTGHLILGSNVNLNTTILGSASSIVPAPGSKITFAGTTAPQFSFTGGGTGVFSATKVSGGTTYTSAPTVSFVGGGGSGATATATIASSTVSAITITNPGSGYTSAPTIVLEGGGYTTIANYTANLQSENKPVFPIDFSNLTVNNAQGVTLPQSWTVNNTLALVAGNITLGANNLTIAAGGSITGGTVSSHIVTNGAGSVTQNIAAGSATTFPVGATATAYSPATVTPTTATAFTASVSNTHAGTPNPTETFNAEEWILTPVIPSSTVLALKPFVAANTTPVPVIAHYGVSSYDDLVAVYSSGTYTATTNAFSPFTTGSTSTPIITLDVNNTLLNKYSYFVKDMNLNIDGLIAGDVVGIYKVNGQKVCLNMAANSHVSIPMMNVGIYVAEVKSGKSINSFKVIVK